MRLYHPGDLDKLCGEMSPGAVDVWDLDDPGVRREVKDLDLFLYYALHKETRRVVPTEPTADVPFAELRAHGPEDRQAFFSWRCPPNRFLLNNLHILIYKLVVQGKFLRGS